MVTGSGSSDGSGDRFGASSSETSSPRSEATSWRSRRRRRRRRRSRWRDAPPPTGPFPRARTARGRGRWRGRAPISRTPSRVSPSFANPTGPSPSVISSTSSGRSRWDSAAVVARARTPRGIASVASPRGNSWRSAAWWTNCPSGVRSARTAATTNETGDASFVGERQSSHENARAAHGSRRANVHARVRLPLDADYLDTLNTLRVARRTARVEAACVRRTVGPERTRALSSKFESLRRVVEKADAAARAAAASEKRERAERRAKTTPRPDPSPVPESSTPRLDPSPCGVVDSETGPFACRSRRRRAARLC